MPPIYIFAGSERYILVRRGTRQGSDEPVAPARARALLEAALRQRDPALIRDLAQALHIHGHDPVEVSSQLLDRLARTGTIGGDLVLLHAQQSEIQRVREPKLEAPEPEPEPILPPPPPEEKEPEARTTFRVSLFFDGTANNRTNTRKANRGKKQEELSDDETNVSRLEMLCQHDPNFEHSYSIYVEGIGTRDGWWNSTYGMATGMGAWGVVGKVERGFKLLLDSIKKRGLDSGEIIELFHIDVFGFSRGAAAARNFIYHVLEKEPIEPKIEALGHPVEKLEINFVGLFDTVASYGLDHDDDSEQLHLDAVKVALKVVQLAAAEEHRAKFRLTDIGSAGAKGAEIFLPGVHSDVGGGYPPISYEKKLQILDFDQFSNKALVQRFEQERQWLIKKGWYKEEGEILDVNFWNELRVNRGPISGEFNRIPLQLMADFAAETGLTWGPISTRFPVPPALDWARGQVAAHVDAHLAGVASTAEYWLDREDVLYQQLRHDYLHFSSHYSSIGMAPQFTNDDPMKGKRKRIVQPDTTPPKAST